MWSGNLLFFVTNGKYDTSSPDTLHQLCKLKSLPAEYNKLSVKVLYLCGENKTLREQMGRRFVISPSFLINTNTFQLQPVFPCSGSPCSLGPRGLQL